MAIFAVIRQSDDSHLGDVVARTYPTAHYKLSDFTWLVAATGTAIDVSASLGLSGAGPNSGIVLEVGSYYGRANPAIWTWIKTNWEASSG
jgi:hypothetical protein